MIKKLAWTFSAIFLSCLFFYSAIYLNIRKVKFHNTDDGEWAVYTYNKSFVRQYALDNKAKDLFNRTMKTGSRTFLAGYTGEVGKDWFCVFIDPGRKYYRLFRIAEEIENRVYQFRPAD